MKPTIAFFALVLFSSVLFAQRTDLSGLKFCIDPGHGGHSSNDRPPVFSDIPFWESDGNFIKALLLKDLLEAQGATVILTRYTNDYPNDADEPSLTARWQTANANNVDWFHSIHSNATGGNNTSTNYTMVLIKEDKTTRQPVWPQAVTMSGYIYSRIRATGRTASSGGNIAPGVYLDYTFYGGTSGGFNLGVLSGLAMPGELSEGSFHDNYAEVSRLMSTSRRKMEAYGIRNGIMQYYGVPADTSCIIAGIVTDSQTGKPLNGVTLRLRTVDSVAITDQYKNGYYAFDGLTAGSWRVVFSAPGYRTDSADVTVNTGAVVFLDHAMKMPWQVDDTVKPAPIWSGPENASVNVTPNHVINLTFNKVLDPSSVLSSTGNIVLREDGTPILFSVLPYTVAGRTGISIWPWMPTAPAVGQPGKTYSVTVSNAKDLLGHPMASPFEFSYSTANVSTQAVTVEPLGGDVSAWGNAKTSPWSTGFDTNSVTIAPVTTPRIPSVTTNIGAAAFKYGWDTTASSWFLDLPDTGGIARSIEWTDTSSLLQLSVNGDAGGMLMRFVVDDSVETFPNGTAPHVEVSPWTRISWAGWKLLEWNMATEAPGTWIGNGVLEGKRRFHGLQFTRDSQTLFASGTIHFDQLQIVKTASLVGVADQMHVPVGLSLEQNFPNPFNPSTVIRFSVPHAGHVRLTISDILGREIAVLAEGTLSAGFHEVVWDGHNAASGVYFYRLRTDAGQVTRRLTLLR